MPIYFFFLLIFFVIPAVILWVFYKEVLFSYKKIFLLTIIPTFLFGVPWDLLSVKTGLWRYDSDPTFGIWFFGSHATGLPLEELLFTLIFPIFLTSIVIVTKKYIH